MSDLLSGMSSVQKLVVGISLAILIVVISSPASDDRAPAGERGVPVAATVAAPSATATPILTPSPTATPTLETVTATPSATSLPTATATFSPGADVPVYSYEIINTLPHDRDAFTQGLVFQDGIFYEGTGLYGRSTLRQVDPETGRVLRSLQLPADVFGEGITIFDDRIIQLTWKARRGFVYDKDSFDLLQEFSYPTEGWGITHDGQRLIVSDGSANLYFWEPTTFEEIGRIEVTGHNGPITRLNELEYVDGEVYANVWQTERIARIDPATGAVTGWILLDGLLGPADRTEPVDVLNGIAYDPATGRLFVTGKFWPRVFEIQLIAQP